MVGVPQREQRFPRELFPGQGLSSECCSQSLFPIFTLTQTLSAASLFQGSIETTGNLLSFPLATLTTLCFPFAEGQGARGTGR